MAGNKGIATGVKTVANAAVQDHAAIEESPTLDLRQHKLPMEKVQSADDLYAHQTPSAGDHAMKTAEAALEA